MIDRATETRRTWRTSAWRCGLAVGAFFFVADFLLRLAMGDGLADSLVSALASTPVLAAVVGIVLSRENRSIDQATADLTAEQRRAAIQAARGEPAPKDDQVRRAAGRLAQRRLDRLQSTRYWWAFGIALIVVGAALVALSPSVTSGLVVLAAAVVVVLLAVVFRRYSLRRLQRRVELLSAH